MKHTDLWLADLSYANLNKITAHNIVLYEAILCHASIKDCDFTGANFKGANLTGTTFQKCFFKGANFTNAINVPPDIAKHLKDWIFQDDTAIDAMPETNGYKIFFSMPGLMSKEEELMTKDFQRMLEEKLHYKVIYYTKDEYPRFGQYGKVRHDIMESCAMVAFGLKQLDIHKASYRPGTEAEETWEERWLSTPWNEIEVGMGLMRGIPILLVSDPSINNGIFDKELSECFVVNISTTEDCRKLLPENEHFHDWLSMLPDRTHPLSSISTSNADRTT